MLLNEQIFPRATQTFFLHTVAAFKAYTDRAFNTLATTEDVGRIVEAAERRIVASNNSVVKSNDELVREVRALREELSAHTATTEI